MNLITFGSQKKKSVVDMQSENCLDNESVEICDGPDGCGYAKASCICDYLRKQKEQTTTSNRLGGSMNSTSI